MVDRADKAWEILGEDEVFAAKPFLTVSRQKVRVSDGRIIDDYYQVKLADFAIACPVTEDGRIITLWQYKHGCRSYGLTFPAGLIEPGEDPREGMLRELAEETGYEARQARALGAYSVSGNQGCGRSHVFLLTGCRMTREPAAGDLETMDLRLMDIPGVDAAIASGRTGILTHLAVWALARPLL